MTLENLVDFVLAKEALLWADGAAVNVQAKVFYVIQCDLCYRPYIIKKFTVAVTF